MLRTFFQGTLTAETFLLLVGYLFAILLALVLHELGHGLVAKWNGDLTAQNAGRLTLNPLKHLDLFGTLLMLFVGFGWAKPVPVNPNYFRHQKKGIFTVSVAGAGANFIQILFFIPMLLLTVYLGTLTGGAYYSYTGVDISSAFFILFYGFFLWGIIANAVLIAFNLLPIYPLDGFHVVEAFTSHVNKFNNWMRRYGSYLLLGLLVMGVIANFLSRFWVGFIYFDILGLYINAISDGMLSLVRAIFGAVYG